MRSKSPVSEAVAESIARVVIKNDSAGGVSIDVPGYRDDSARWTSVERVAWELARAFLCVAPGRGAWLIPEELTKWRARAADEIHRALQEDDLTLFDLERYLEVTR